MDINSRMSILESEINGLIGQLDDDYINIEDYFIEDVDNDDLKDFELYIQTGKKESDVDGDIKTEDIEAGNINEENNFPSNKNNIELYDSIKYPCFHCDYKSTTKSYLAVHVKSIHENIKFKCNECEYRARV